MSGMPCASPRLEIAFAQRMTIKGKGSCKCELVNAGRTLKPGDAAQALVPSTLKMAPLSRLPVATRLNGISAMSMMKMYGVVSTLCQHRLHNPTQSAYLRAQRIDGLEGSQRTLPRHGSWMMEYCRSIKRWILL